MPSPNWAEIKISKIILGFKDDFQVKYIQNTKMSSFSMAENECIVITKP
jgi:hypothetical protein